MKAFCGKTARDCSVYDDVSWLRQQVAVGRWWFTVAMDDGEGGDSCKKKGKGGAIEGGV